ncbi:MAG TPA: alpha/beta hydrolase [Ramlibacter sp.]|nr:alpha/beta hydrolase [Ramlibacter sp.]
MAATATVLIVPGMRDAVPQHWQTLLAASLAAQGVPVREVAPMGRENLNCKRSLDAIEAAAAAIDGPLVVVAHSGGSVMVAHWAKWTRRAVQGALLATPPDLSKPMPDPLLSFEALQAGGWLPVPQQRLPFPSILAASRNDALATYESAAAMAKDWGSTLVDLGEVGHLNPASGFGEWPRALDLIAQLQEGKS